MTRSAVDDDPDKTYIGHDNNVYRKTSMIICEWAEDYSDVPSDLKTLVLQSIESTRALLDILVCPESIEDPLFRLKQTGKHVLKALQFLKANPVTRSRIIE
jgi:hypothetical protein